MVSIISIVLEMVFLPFIYFLLVLWYRPDFEKEENKRRRPLSSAGERIVILISEIALVRFWYVSGMRGIEDLSFTLVYIMLAGMTVFCMMDIWERVVPNKLLLLFLLLFVVVIGIYGMQDIDTIINALDTIILGVIFCALCFGMGYLLSKKSMGAGDVKLSLVLGLYLTGEYVVGAVVYGCFVGAAYSMIQLARKKLTRKDTIPFVPFLYIGLIIRCLVG